LVAICAVVLQDGGTSLGVLWTARLLIAVYRVVTPGSVSQNITMHVIAPEDGIICAYVANYVPHPTRRLSQSLADGPCRNHTQCGVVDMCPSCTELLLTTE